MTRVNKGVQNFQKMTNAMLKEAAKDGKNITKAQVTDAIGKLTADGKVSKADRDAAQALLEDAPLTAGAKEALENFVSKGTTTTTNTRPNNPLNARLAAGGSESRRGGGETGGSRRGGSESGGARPSRGGGEHAPARPSRPSRGGGEYTPARPSRGGGEYGGGGYSGGGGGWGGGGGGE